MGYKRISIMNILEIARRYFNKESIKSISEQTGFDRKTIRKYIGEIKSAGISEYNRDKIISVASEVIPQIKGRPNKRRDKLKIYTAEINGYLENDLKIKTIYEILFERHDLDISYSSFRRYLRETKLIEINTKTTCRLEKTPGEELQVDYAKMGMLYDPIQKKKRTAYAFIGTLSYSRHKFVEIVYSQNQQSFVQSHVRMFSYFGAVPKILTIDNLKSGVIKPDLYDPELNRTYAEMAEHYGCFINTARVATPKDKPIVERDVQTIREQFKKLKAIDENLTITEANKKLTDWLINNYGKTNHGTTREKPYEVFTNKEKLVMLPLPKESYEAPLWKEAKVHPDHYIQVNKKSYSLPTKYVGKQVWVKVTHRMVYVYYEEKLIKQHTIPSGSRQTDLNDFPENMQYALNKGMPAYLLNQAKAISEEFGNMVKNILTPHPFINMRKAQSLIRIAGAYPRNVVTEASIIAMNTYRNIKPKNFSKIIEQITSDKSNASCPKEEKSMPISHETSSFIRNEDYFIHPTFKYNNQ